MSTEWIAEAIAVGFCAGTIISLMLTPEGEHPLVRFFEWVIWKARGRG